jgi:tetratricopeptide (TPR) repeat protein
MACGKESLLGKLSSKNMRSWLFACLCGALIVLSIYPLWDVWVVNVASVTVNRVVVSDSSLSEVKEVDEATLLNDALDGTTAIIEDPGARPHLQEVMALMEDAASNRPHTTAREVPIWRTYGAAARLAPSEHAYQVLLRSRDAGRVDRIGELWLGEVAASTGHFDEAAKAYRRIDASNLLIHRAETALAAGDEKAAVRQYKLAYDSLEAALERVGAEQLLLDRTGNEPSMSSRLLQRSADRVTSLYRIGRGLLNAEQPSQAIPILEEAMQAAETGSPGALIDQGIHLNLAMALAKTLPAGLPMTTEETTHYAIDASQYEHIQALTRIRTLVARGISLNLTASACVQAGRIMFLAGDDASATAHLNRAMELDPLLPQSYLALGRHYESQGMSFSAQTLYKRGADLSPTDPALAAAYAIASYKTMRPEAALPLLRQASEMKGASNPYVFVYLGDCYVDLDMKGHAQAAYRSGLECCPGNTTLLRRLAGLPFSHKLLP